MVERHIWDVDVAGSNPVTLILMKHDQQYIDRYVQAIVKATRTKQIQWVSTASLCKRYNDTGKVVYTSYTFKAGYNGKTIYIYADDNETPTLTIPYADDLQTESNTVSESIAVTGSDITDLFYSIALPENKSKLFDRVLVITIISFLLGLIAGGCLLYVLQKFC